MKMKSCNTRIVALALLAATAVGIALFPVINQARAIQQTGGVQLPPQKHRVEVVFILDTTSSMSGLIQAAKDKIWSIASTMASARQNPDIRMGLVAFRDRGDAYVTKVYDLSEDLDSMHRHLLGFRAEGGGDGPESVNQALYDAIHKISWSQDGSVYRVAFLVGDAPPHMDYPDDVRYPATLAAAQRKGIVVNTIQSGQHDYTRPAWREIAALGAGQYFQVEDSGNAVAVATPFDEKLSKLATELEATRLFYGDAQTRGKQLEKIEAYSKAVEELPPMLRARRSEFNATESGRKNLFGERELIESIVGGRVALEDIPTEELPASLQSVAPEARKEVIDEQARRRDALRQQIKKLSDKRNRYIREEIEAAGGADDSLDEQIYRAVKEQAGSVGLEYDGDSARY